MNQVTIPPLITLPKQKDWDEWEDFNPVFHIRTINLSTFPFTVSQKSHQLFQLTNENPITVFGNSSQIVMFPVLFITSLPALCVLTGDALLYRFYLSQSINCISTNDMYPHITLFNYTRKSITIKPSQLTVYCQIILARNPSCYKHL
jgi:hypothetical protein